MQGLCWRLRRRCLARRRQQGTAVNTPVPAGCRFQEWGMNVTSCCAEWKTARVVLSEQRQRQQQQMTPKAALKLAKRFWRLSTGSVPNLNASHEHPENIESLVWSTPAGDSLLQPETSLAPETRHEQFPRWLPRRRPAVLAALTLAKCLTNQIATPSTMLG